MYVLEFGSKITVYWNTEVVYYPLKFPECNWRWIWTFNELNLVCFNLGWSFLCVCSSMSCTVRWISRRFLCRLVICIFAPLWLTVMSRKRPLLPAASSPSSLDTEGELRGKTLSSWCLYWLMDGRCCTRSCAFVFVLYCFFVSVLVNVELWIFKAWLLFNTSGRSHGWIIRNG